MSDRFFHRPSTDAAIADIAAQDAITLVLGAGVSASGGLPTWSELVRDLVEDSCLLLSSLSPQEKDRFSSILSEDSDLLSTGSIVRAILGKPLLLSKVKDHLYRSGVPTRAGYFAQQVAEMALVWHKTNGRVRIITTNYDDLIERAFYSPSNQALAESMNVRPETVLSPDEDTKPGTIPVYHIHGSIPYDAKMSDDIILSERDFGLSSLRDWTETLAALSATDALVFAGSSFMDPNLNRYLRIISSARRSSEQEAPRRLIFRQRQVSTKPVYSLLALQGQLWKAEADGIRTQLLTALNDRLEYLGVTPLSPDYFMQVPQLLHEASLCRAAALVASPAVDYFADESRLKYGHRLADWSRQVEHERLRHDENFFQSQTELQRALALMRNEITHALEVKPESERLKVELWVRNQHRRSLVLSGSSETIACEPSHLPEHLLAVDSGVAAVSAFCSGSTAPKQINEGASRWRYFLGFPVRLESERWQRLPVAVLAVASTSDEGHSRLNHARHNVEEAMKSALRSIEQYLDPDEKDFSESGYFD